MHPFPIWASRLLKSRRPRVRPKNQEGGAGGTTTYRLGVLARDDALGRYIALQLEPGAVTGRELEEIARSVEFGR